LADLDAAGFKRRDGPIEQRLEQHLQLQLLRGLLRLLLQLSLAAAECRAADAVQLPLHLLLRPLLLQGTDI